MNQKFTSFRQVQDFASRTGNNPLYYQCEAAMMGHAESIIEIVAKYFEHEEESE